MILQNEHDALYHKKKKNNSYIIQMYKPRNNIKYKTTSRYNKYSKSRYKHISA